MNNSEIEILNRKINSITDIYILKKSELVILCDSNKLKSVGKTDDLRGRLSRFYKGVTTDSDLVDELSSEQKLEIRQFSFENRIELKKIVKELKLDDSSDSEKDKVFGESSKTLVKGYSNLDEQLNCSADRILSHTDKLILLTDNLYQNKLEGDSEDKYVNSLLDNKEKNHIYEDIELANNDTELTTSSLPENSEIAVEVLKKTFKVEEKDTSTKNHNGISNESSILYNTIYNKKEVEMETSVKTWMVKPDNFCGIEDVRKFFKQYEKAAEVNRWKDEDKVKFLSIFLKGIASTFLENLEDKKNSWNWDDLKTEFLDEFQPIGYLTLIKNKLETKRQNDLETVMGFVAEVEHLCRQLDKNMKEEDICVYILRGLKESVLNSISLHDNSNLKKLKDNLKKYELMQFRINNRGPGINEYTDIINKQVTQLDRQREREIEDLRMRLETRDRDYRREIEKLTEEIKNINVLGKNKTVNFDSKSDDNLNYYKERNYDTERNNFNKRNDYRNKSPYPGKFNSGYDRNRRDRSVSGDRERRNRSFSRDRQYRRSRDNSTDRNYNRQYYCDDMKDTYHNRNNSYDRRSRDREMSKNYDRQYYSDGRKNERYSRDNSYDRSYINQRHSRENSRDRFTRSRTPEKYQKETRGDLDRVICYRCNSRGHYADMCNFSKNLERPSRNKKSDV